MCCITFNVVLPFCKYFSCPLFIHLSVFKPNINFINVMFLKPHNQLSFSWQNKTEKSYIVIFIRHSSILYIIVCDGNVETVVVFPPCGAVRQVLSLMKKTQLLSHQSYFRSETAASRQSYIIKTIILIYLLFLLWSPFYWIMISVLC